jgi:uncharacterized paraquat-inducible protein A
MSTLTAPKLADPSDACPHCESPLQRKGAAYCPKCKGQLWKPKQCRLHGGVLLVAGGVVLLFGVGLLLRCIATAWPGSETAASYRGSGLQLMLTFGLAAALVGFGAVTARVGLWQMREGRIDPRRYRPLVAMLLAVVGIGLMRLVL